jgi:hypothetical protein
VELKDQHLRRFWFPTAGQLGIGVTAYTLDEAETLARRVANRLRWELPALKVVQDVDVRALDQHHVIPNMLPPNVHGVWFPKV